MTFDISPEPNIEPRKDLKKSSTKHVMVEEAAQPHQVMTAGQSIIFVVLTIIVGVILNSSSLYVKATAMEDSFARDVAVNALKPFDAISRGIGLTSVRKEVRSAMDLPRDDKIDTFTFSGTNFSKVPQTTLPQLGPTNKLSMWLIGDSLSVTPSESMLGSFSQENFNILGMDGRVSTGLSRSDVFNWFTHINNFVVANKPQVIVATFGANDDQPIFTGTGYVGPFASEAWKAKYKELISSTLDFLASQGVHTLWIEIPPVRDPARNDRYRIINEVNKQAVLAHPKTATYVETKAAFTNPDGSYSDSIVINGTPTLLRAADGVHFTRAGGNVISNLVTAKLATLYKF